MFSPKLLFGEEKFLIFQPYNFNIYLIFKQNFLLLKEINISSYGNDHLDTFLVTHCTLEIYLYNIFSLTVCTFGSLVLNSFFFVNSFV